jgi:predicted nucleotidyltransferase
MSPKPRLPRNVKAALKELKQGLWSVYGRRLRGVYLYGSYARGDFDAKSDVDVLVVLGGPIEPGDEIARINDVATEICLKYDLVISTMPVARGEFDNDSQAFIEQVRDEVIRV